MLNVRTIAPGMCVALWLAATTLAANAVPSFSGGQNAPTPLNQATDALTRGDLAGAQAAFLALNAANPKAPEPYLGLAEIAARKNDVHAAETYLTRGIAAAPKTLELRVARARLFAIMRRAPEAIADYQSAIAIAPRQTGARLELANFLSQRLGQPAKAIPLFQQALAIEPTNAIAHYGLGVSYGQLRRYDDAVKALSNARKFAPNNPLSSMGLAQIYLIERNFKAALDAINMALAVKPDLSQAHALKGDILLASQSPRLAAAEYDAILKTEPNYEPALLGLAMAQQQDGRSDSAEATYRVLLAKNAKNTIALNNLAMILAGRGDRLAEAYDLANQAVVLAPKIGAFHDTLGFVALQRKAYAQAVSEFTQSLKIQPSADTYAHLGEAQAAMGKKDDAQKSFRAALKLSPQDAAAQKGLLSVTRTH